MIFKNDYVISKDGTEIHYLQIGNKNAQKVFLFHGMLGDRKMWFPFIIPILHKYHFIIPDMRGHGKSGMNNYKSHECFEYIPDDLNAVRNKVLGSSSEKYKVAGYSMGTVSALLLCEKYGLDNCEKYIHMDHSTNFSIENGTNNKIFQEFYDEFSGIMNYAQETLESDLLKYRDYTYDKLDEDQKKLADTILKIIVFDTTMVGIKERFPFLKFWMIEPFVRVGTNFNERLPDYMILGHQYTSNERDFSPILEQVKCPITFFVGGNNKLFSTESQLKSIREHRPDAKIVMFEKSGHDLLINEFWKFATQFWKELES